MEIKVIHFPNRSKSSGRVHREKHETVHHAFMRVTAVNRKGKKVSFRVEGLDSQPVLFKKVVTAAYVEALVKELKPGQIIAFVDVKAWWRVAKKARAPTQV